MKRTTSLIVGGLLSLSLIAAGSPVAYAATAPTVSQVSAEASAYAKNRVKVTLIHDDNDGRVSAGARTVLKGKVTGERAGQVVYLEEKVTSGGKSRWKVIDKIKHNGRFSFTVAPEHGSHEFRTRVRTKGVKGVKGVKGTGPVMTRMKAMAPTGGDVTSESVTVDAATVFTLYVQNSTAAIPLKPWSNITFNYGVANSSGATALQNTVIDACPTKTSFFSDCGPAGGALVNIRVPQEAAVAWSITAKDEFLIDQTYYPEGAGSNCPAGLFADSSAPTAAIVITNPNTYGYMANIRTKNGSCDVRLLSKAEGWVASAVDTVGDWCTKNTGMKVLCGALGVVVVGAIIYFSGGSAAEAGTEEAVSTEAQTLFDVNAEPAPAEAEIPVNNDGIVSGWSDNTADLGQGYDEDDEPFQKVPVEQGANISDTIIAN